MKTLSSINFNVSSDACQVNQRINDAFKLVQCHPSTSKVRMELTLEVLHDGGDSNGKVLLASTLSRFDLSGNHAVRAAHRERAESSSTRTEITGYESGKFKLSSHAKRLDARHG